MADIAEPPMPFSQMTLVDWLDDLTVRFLLNLPPAELSSMPRLCFQVEEAQWFYEDFIRPLNPHLPSLNLRQFCMTLFQHCPLLSAFNAAQHLAAYEEFLAYKVRVPVRGAILMDASMEKALLVRGWKKGASWSFPRGKINKDEKDIDCAIREVYEETGFDINAAGLVQANEVNGQVKSIEVTMREQHMKLFVFRGVPLDTYFEPKTRKEISKIQWYNVKDLPGFKKNKGGPGYGQREAQANKFYMVAPFLGHLKKWIGHQRKRDAAEVQNQHIRTISSSHLYNVGEIGDEGDTEVDLAPDYATDVPTTSADELKRLLSIGPATTSEMLQVQQPQSQNDLLAILKGLGHSQQTADHTHPTEHMNPVPDFQTTDMAQRSDFRYSNDQFSQQQQFGRQSVPSPQYQQQQQHLLRNFSTPPTDFSTHGLGSEPSAHPHLTFPANSLPRNGQLSMPNPQYPLEPAFNQLPPPPNQRSSSQLHFDRSEHYANRLQLASAPIPPGIDNLQAASWQQRQGSMNPAVSGPKVPEASKLPIPSLNTHSMSLLNAFKTTNQSSSMPDAHALNDSSQQKAGSQQQAALLGLFKKHPSKGVAAENAPQGSHGIALEPPIVPAIPSRKPAVQNPGDRKLTANEITRTLAFNPKPKSAKQQVSTAMHEQAGRFPVQQDPSKSNQARALQPSPLHAQSSPEAVRLLKEQPSSPKPAGSARQEHSSSQSRKMERGSTAAPTSILQRPSSKHTDGSQNPSIGRTPQEQSSSTPQFSILQRPGSSAGKAPRPSAPQSPLRNEAHTSKFHPQVLKRPDPGRTDDIVVGTNEPRGVESANGKTDQLLALFGKSPATTPGPQRILSPASGIENRPTPTERKDLISLFNTGPTPTVNAVSTDTPPPAPRLLPERDLSQPQTNLRPQNQQHLLDLFSVQNSSSASNPGTPISPFTLNTPITKIMTTAPLIMENPGESRSRLGSATSIVSSGANSGRQTPTPTAATPTEAKGVLLNYLHGVVKEGYRGSKRTGS